MIIKILLWINISLFILHEMDAVKAGEWRMIKFSEKLNDNMGHFVFTSLHLPLFLIIFYLMYYHFIFLFIFVSVFLIVHQFMHILFRDHAENKMNNVFSKIIIFLMFVNSCISLVYYYITIVK